MQHKDKLIETYEQQQKEIIENFDRKMEETIAKLRKKRKELVEELAEKQSKFKLRISDVEQKVVKKVESLNADFKTLKWKNLTLVDDLKKLSAGLVKAQALCQNCKLFLTMKLTNKTCEKLTKNMQELQNNNIYCYKVEPKLDSKPSIQSLETTRTFFSYKVIHKSALQRTATFYTDINYQFKEYATLCLLNENTLLATDKKSNSIVIFKITKTTSQCFDTIKVLSKPWAITSIRDNKVAVTFPEEGIIRMITFSEPISVVNSDDIRVRLPCYGTAYSNNNFIVSNEESRTVQILDMSGHIIRTIDKDSMGKPLFTSPLYMAVSPDNTTIYVSDWSSDTVTSMTFDGKVKAIYKDVQLSTPYQLTVDDPGSVYVCEIHSNNVHQLSSDLTKVKILLNTSHGMNQPVSVVHCNNGNKLYVGMRNRNIKVFNLSLK
ncbi:uncharacterized protein LOC128550836 [Mercenaria mercenaria]|uniref:uncharacterized protein LOC128550836 n=1 Tax=Mercenaria mercenaria TaxID=6596 RepID=UPI00234F7843|nr:uncharacterized protein LOC128550836 [Mercenaria mercenaria]